MYFSLIKEQILHSTNRGRDLIVECYPEFVGVADDKKIKLRKGEKDASAHIHLLNNVYILKDFGDGAGKDGIAVYAETHAMEYADAVRALAGRYGIEENKSAKVFGPKFDSRPLSGEMKAGEKKIVVKSEFTKAELNFLGPNVTCETVKQLNWHSVDHLVICQETKELLVYSTANYPIFARELHDIKTGELIGHKIYEPRFKSKDGEKNYKFTYCPKGMEPGSYVHGLYELESIAKDKEGGKVKDVAICCGERDALVVKSMDIHPIWLNSETTEIPASLYARLKELASNIYYFPDIDSTGRKKAMTNIRNCPELKTVWLPAEMMKSVGDQQKPCKDLRDWAGLHRSKADFRNLLNAAKQYQFWYYDEDGKPHIDSDNLLYFYSMNGYFRIWNDITEVYDFVRIEGHKVTKVQPVQIRQFMLDWIKEQPKCIRNLVLKGRKAALENLNDLPLSEVDFKNSTATSQVFCFNNCQYKVTEEGIFELDEDSECNFWDKNIIKHNFKKLPDMFKVERYEDENGKTQFCIIPTEGNCKLFNVFIKTSMIYWLKEDEGCTLSQNEEMEENKCLTTKMFGFAHMLHRYKDKSRGWSIISMDNNTKPNSKVAEGGTGKSFIFDDVLPAMGYNVLKCIPTKDNPLEDSFIFDQVTTETDIFFVDECPDKFQYNKLNDYITGVMNVNKKNKSRFSIPFNRSPKFAFATNFPIYDFGGSVTRRLIPALYGDYYHYASENNGYTTSRTIRDDFGMVLMGDDYSEEDWNRDINFCLQCMQFYLRVVNEINDKLTPDMSAIIKRHNSGEYTDEFGTWANEFFSDPKNLNYAHVAESLVIEYNRGDRPKIEKKELKRQLKAWVSCQDGLEYNPLDKCNDKKDRRIRCKYGNVNTEQFYIAGTYEGE